MKNTENYKNVDVKRYIRSGEFVAEVEYNAEGKFYFGKIANIDDLVMFEGINENQLSKAFADVIEDYQKTCKEMGQKINFKEIEIGVEKEIEV